MLLCMSTIGYAHRINAYKFIHIDETGNMYDVEKRLTDYFISIGFQTVDSYEVEKMSGENKKLLLYAKYEWNIIYGGSSTLVLTLSDYNKGTTIFKASGQGKTFSAKGDMRVASKGIFKQIDALNYKFIPEENNVHEPDTESFAALPEDSVKNVESKSFFQNLQDAQEYFSNHILDLDPIEGIYDVDYSFVAYHKGTIVYPYEKKHIICAIYSEEESFKYRVQELEGESNISSIEKLGETGFYNLNYQFKKGRGNIPQNISKIRFQIDDMFYFEVAKNNGIRIDGETFYINCTYTFLKRFPTKKQYQIAIQDVGKGGAKGGTSMWTGTGFALNEGYLVTNHHVIDGALSIKVYGIHGDFNSACTAKVVGVDKTNDLALLKIESYRATNSDVIPYSIKFSTADVGEDVFVLGYPLTQLLGNEIKLTNGIISSRTGFDGNVNNYQMSAPVQPGNSGGPVFDKNGNVIGIVVAGINNNVAQNANYAIKTSCLSNLVESVASNSIFPTGKNLRGLSLVEQTKKVKNFVYYIECSSNE